MPRLLVEGNAPIEVEAGTSLLDACDDHGIEMESSCGGFAACNTCRVQVLDGAGNLSPLDPEEEPFLDAPNQRLGCQALLLGDATVRLDPGQ